MTTRTATRILSISLLKIGALGSTTYHIREQCILRFRYVFAAVSVAQTSRRLEGSAYLIPRRDPSLRFAGENSQSSSEEFSSRALTAAAVPGRRTRLVWGAGNHFLDRMTRYLTQVARGLARLDSLRIDKILDLDGLDVELVQAGSFVSPKGTESQLPQRILWEHYLVTHGTRLGAHPAASELSSWGMSGSARRGRA